MYRDELHDFMKSRDYVWSFKDGARVPTREELEEHLDRMVQTVQDSEDQTQLSLGRLIVKKDGDHVDLYILWQPDVNL